MDNIEEEVHSIDGVFDVKEEETEEKPTLNDVPNIPAISTEPDEFEGIDVYNPKYIQKKVQYNSFLKALKKNDFTTAYMLAKALRISPDTIQNWLKTPKAIKIMQNDINEYVNKIRVAKDWKAQAYLLDKVTGADEVKQQTQTTLIGLTINIPKA